MPAGGKRVRALGIELLSGGNGQDELYQQDAGEREMDLWLFDVVCRLQNPLYEYGDPSDCITEIAGIIRCSPDGGETIRKAGKLRLFRLNAEVASDHGISIRDACDSHSEGLLNYAKVLYQGRSNVLKQRLQEQFDAISSDVLVLDSCVLASKYRGQGIGLLAMRRCIDLFGGGCDLIVCLPCPLSGGGEFPVPDRVLAGFSSVPKSIGRRKLAQYWTQLGFRPIGRNGYHGLSMTHPHPTFNEVVEMVEALKRPAPE